MHRIGRQTIELQVGSEGEARELHGELSRSFQARLMPVFDEVLTAACPAGASLRIPRLEIDAGIVPREGLLDAIAVAVRAQLAAQLGLAVDGEPATRDASGPSTLRDDVRVVGHVEGLVERLETLVESGVVSWRDASIAADALEGTVRELLDAAPAAVARVFARATPGHAALRIWTSLSVATRGRVFELFGVRDAAQLERFVAEWTAMLVAWEQVAGVPARGAAPHDIARWLRLEVWSAVISRTEFEVMARRLSARIVETIAAARGSVREPERDAAGRRLAAVAAERLSAGSLVRQFIEQHVATPRAGAPDSVTRAGRRDPPRRTRTTDAPSDDHGTARSSGTAADTEHSTDESPIVDHAELLQSDAERGDGLRASTASGEHPARTPSSSQTSFRLRTEGDADPLWVAHAGGVIVWPFLKPVFEACGLVSDNDFIDAAARERAVLLTAHLVTGACEWGEHDLLLEKALCGWAIDEPIALAFTPGEEESRQVAELLDSIIHHWNALQSTSVDGLRRAFLCRAGTLTAIASGWKLDIPRTGYDVLLDRLPWGIGVVLLPWMEQPLHVEW